MDRKKLIKKYGPTPTRFVTTGELSRECIEGAWEKALLAAVIDESRMLRVLHAIRDYDDGIDVVLDRRDRVLVGELAKLAASELALRLKEMASETKSESVESGSFEPEPIPGVF